MGTVLILLHRVVVGRDPGSWTALNAAWAAQASGVPAAAAAAAS